MSDIFDWSLIPGDNATADTAINWSEGQFPSTVNNSARQMMARIAEYIADNGVLTATGTNTIAVTSNSPITTVKHGMTLSFRAQNTNTGAVTLNLNGLGGKDIRKTTAGSTDSVALVAGDINTKGVYLVVYDSATNGGVGAWILINPLSAAYLPITGGTLTGPLTVPQINIDNGSLGGQILNNGTNGISYFTAGGSHSWSGTGIPTMQWGASGLSLGVDLAITEGGTGASTAAGARTNLGLGTMATQNANAVSITGGTAALTNLSSTTGIVAGSATFATNGDIVSSLWSTWGSASAFTAIDSRITARGNDFINYSLSQVMPTVASANTGTVGTYAFLKYLDGAITPGADYPSARLRYSGSDLHTGDVPAGTTWRAAGATNGANQATLFLRRV